MLLNNHISTKKNFFSLILDNTTVLKRSYVTSTDWAPSIWGVAEFIEKRQDIDILILLQATSPFINFKYLRSAHAKLNFPIPFDCVFSVTR